MLLKFAPENDCGSTGARTCEINKVTLKDSNVQYFVGTQSLLSSSSVSLLAAACVVCFNLSTLAACASAERDIGKRGEEAPEGNSKLKEKLCVWRVRAIRSTA